jgi:hypothetical protein
LDWYGQEDATAVDHWVSYALSHADAAPPPAGIELDLRFNRAGLCPRPYGLRAKAQPSRKRSRSTSSSSSPNDSEEDENEDPRWFKISVSEKFQPSLKSLNFSEFQ